MVSIAQVLARDPQLVFLDEPTGSLDLQRQIEVLALLRSVTAVRKIITLISLHDLNLAARFAAYFVVMTEGQIYASGDAACVLTPGMLCDVYQVNAGVRADDDSIAQVTPISSARETNGAVASAS